MVTLPENVNAGDVNVTFEYDEKEREKLPYETSTFKFVHTFSIQEVCPKYPRLKFLPFFSVS